MRRVALLCALCVVLSGCASPHPPVRDAQAAIALAKNACRTFPNAGGLTAWTATLHGAEWEVEGRPGATSGEGASVMVPVDGPGPASCAAFFFKQAP